MKAQKAHHLVIILIGLITLTSIGCKEGPSLNEFLTMDSAQADRLDIMARYEVVQEILWILDDPFSEDGMSLFQVYFGEKAPPQEEPREGFGEGALFSVYLGGELPKIEESPRWALLSTPETIIDRVDTIIHEGVEDGAGEVSVILDFRDSDIPWGVEPVEGLGGFSEMDLLESLAGFALPPIEAAVAESGASGDLTLQVVRAEGAPFLAAYNHATGELSLNPNYLRLVSLLPPSALSQFTTFSTKGFRKFDLCMEYQGQKLMTDVINDFMEDSYCNGIIGMIACSFAAAITAVALMGVSIPIFMVECFHFLLQCGTVASSAAGTLPIAFLLILPLAALKVLSRQGTPLSLSVGKPAWDLLKGMARHLSLPILYSALVAIFVIVILLVIVFTSAEAAADPGAPAGTEEAVVTGTSENQPVDPNAHSSFLLPSAYTLEDDEVSMDILGLNMLGVRWGVTDRVQLNFGFRFLGLYAGATTKIFEGEKSAFSIEAGVGLPVAAINGKYHALWVVNPVYTIGDDDLSFTMGTAVGGIVTQEAVVAIPYASFMKRMSRKTKFFLQVTDVITMGGDFDDHSGENYIFATPGIRIHGEKFSCDLGLLVPIYYDGLDDQYWVAPLPTFSIHF